MKRHIVQTCEWADFKNAYGTPAICVDNLVYTKHKIPFSGNYFAYCPRVNPFEIDFPKLKKSLKDNNCVSINFDVPNIFTNSEDASRAIKVFIESGCIKSPRDQFAKANIILDITKTEDALLSTMHTKHRYNIKYAQKKGVVIKRGEAAEDFSNFYTLFKQTAERQKYYVRGEDYYKKLWDMFRVKGMAEILTAELDGKALASWMFLIYDKVLYYPYGGSSEEERNLHASNLVAWEGILLGKSLGCESFDMWGAAENPEDEKDPWWGFTNFKMKFGGEYVTYIDSFDYVINEPIYRAFSIANDIRWKVLKVIA